MREYCNHLKIKCFDCKEVYPENFALCSKYNKFPRTLVCGSRYWTDLKKVKDTLIELNPIEIIEGGAPGADTCARIAGRELMIKVTTITAKWYKYGLAAGPIRNQEMIDLKPDIVLAFHEDLSKSKGTKDTIKRANDNKIEVVVVS
jgi:hypothetical protein